MRRGVLLEKSKVKSPVFSLILGFLLPPLGALYNGRWALGLLFFFLELAFDAISTISLGMPRILYGLFGAYLSHKWAKEANTAALEKLLLQASP